MAERPQGAALLRLSGWGRVAVAETTARRPERIGEVASALWAAGPGGVIARGLGRAYGDAALNQGGDTILTERLDRLLAFDAATGALDCEAGVTIDDLVDVFLPRGWMPPVCPGTAFVTLGGALANDVHGKNHDRVGSFADHVRWFDLLAADGAVRRVTPDSDPALFAATCGGIGLSGIVLRLGLALERVPSPAVRLREERMASLDDFLSAFATRARAATWSVGWIDALARGGSLGRGILETAEPAPAGTAVARDRRGALPVPFDLPGSVLNAAGVAAFNELYFRRVPAGGRERSVGLRRFLFPLDALSGWNRLYGSRGFRQFQCVLPDAEAEKGLRALLEAAAQSRAASFLAVIKTLGGDGRGFLSFPMRGITLALDFPNRPDAPDLLHRLERITLDHGGRIYLAKDSALSPEGFARMYPRLDELRRVLAAVDPQGRFRSDMARRLRIREDVA
ncbi:MAG: FAD-binding oxidoreductase [Alphaproteobacteria bacterium]|nr:FAD-binding oxidoreductase [Alphaproteobacteria bacterium]